jgi:hypothetical protein
MSADAIARSISILSDGRRSADVVASAQPAAFDQGQRRRQ